MKLTARLVFLSLAIGSVPACVTFGAPQTPGVPTCIDPARPCDRNANDSFGWAQDSLHLSSR